MKPAAALIQGPAIDFHTFLGIAHQALGRSPAHRADGDSRVSNDALKFLACLSDCQGGPVLTASPHHLCHVTYSVVLAADERTLREILACADGMPVLMSDTVAPAVVLILLTGNLNQWRDAVVSGTSREPPCRSYFCRIQQLFEEHGLGHIWRDYNKRETPDSFYVLEHK